MVNVVVSHILNVFFYGYYSSKINITSIHVLLMTTVDMNFREILLPLTIDFSEAILNHISGHIHPVVHNIYISFS